MQKVKKLHIIIIIIGIAGFIYLFLFSRNQKGQFSKLENEGIIDTAVIIREFTGAKRKQYFEYEFYVGQKCYNGFLHYSPSHGPIDIGDSIFVKYLPSDPDNINELIREKNKTLKKLKEVYY